MSEAYHVKTKKELIETLEGIQQERNFNSRGETLEFLVQVYQGKPLGLEKPIECEYLSSDGSLCGVEDKFHKTTPQRCELCQRKKQWAFQRKAKLNGFTDFCVQERWKEILGENTQLKTKVDTMANALLERDRRIALLEEMASPKLFEENQRLRFELTQKEKQLEDYATEIEKLDALNKRLKKFLPTTTSLLESV